MNTLKKFHKIFKVTNHTQHVGPKSLFYVFNSGKNNKNYIEEAYKKGARGFFFRKEDIPNAKELKSKLPEAMFFEVNSNKPIFNMFAEHCAKTYGYPAKKIVVIGITGTKGKSSTAIIMSVYLKNFGYKVAMMSSAFHCINNDLFEAQLTTEKADYIHAFLSEALQKGVTHAIIEVSAQALSLSRMYGIAFDLIIFTNFYPDHLEFFGSDKNYFEAKTKIFENIKKNGTILYPSLDKKVSKFIKNFSKKNSFGIKYVPIDNSETNQRKFEITAKSIDGLSIKINNIASNMEYFLKTKLYGTHNAENIFVSYLAICNLLKNTLPNQWTKCFENFSNFSFIPGRGERYTTENNIKIYIDNVHNPLPFENILSDLKDQSEHLLVIFGCGGDRDYRRRKELAQIAEKYAREIFITEDNPRNESLENITENILSGFSKIDNVHIINDRILAIGKAMKLAKSNSIVALLGRGNSNLTIRGINQVDYGSDLEIIRSLGYNVTPVETTV